MFENVLQLKKREIDIRDCVPLYTVLINLSIIIQGLMSTAVFRMIVDDLHCPRSPTMRPLKLKAQLLETKDFLCLPERANASVMKHKI